MKRWPVAVLMAWSAHAAAEAPATEEPAAQTYWERGVPRPFASASLELGWTYARPEVSVGFGRPFYRAMSLDAKPLVTGEGAGAYLGVRGTVPFLEMRAGVRRFEAFERTLLPRREHHERAELYLREGPESAPVSLDGELSGAVSVPGGGPFWLLGVYYLSNVRPGFHVYDESLKVIVDPPWLWRFRVGYAWRFGPREAIRLGVAEEILHSPERPSYVIRVGFVGSVAIEQNVDVQLTFMPVVHSPDSLGLAGADFGQLGVRWRWATAGPRRRRP